MSNPIEKLPISTVGCWIDGHWGRFGTSRLLSIADELGWTEYNDPDLQKAIACLDGIPNDCDTGNCSCAEIVYDATDTAEAWMNENIAPDGYAFGWFDGEFFLWSAETWEESF